MSRIIFRAALSLSLALASSAAMAGVGKISSPEVTKGEYEIEYSGSRLSDDGKALNNQQSHKTEFEYSFTDSLQLGLELEAERESPTGSKFSGYGIEAQYQFTDQKNWWLSSATQLEYFHAAHDGDPDETEIQLLASRTDGKMRWLGNLDFNRELGNNRDHGVGVSSALQGSYELNEHIAPGIEWQADYGAINNISDNNNKEHYVGPIITGELFELGNSELEYTAGYYWGLTGPSADHAARLQLSYEMHF